MCKTGAPVICEGARGIARSSVIKIQSALGVYQGSSLNILCDAYRRIKSVLNANRRALINSALYRGNALADFQNATLPPALCHGVPLQRAEPSVTYRSTPPLLSPSHPGIKAINVSPHSFVHSATERNYTESGACRPPILFLARSTSRAIFYRIRKKSGEITGPPCNYAVH